VESTPIFNALDTSVTPKRLIIYCAWPNTPWLILQCPNTTFKAYSEASGALSNCPYWRGWYTLWDMFIQTFYFFILKVYPCSFKWGPIQANSSIARWATPCDAGACQVKITKLMTSHAKDQNFGDRYQGQKLFADMCPNMPNHKNVQFIWNTPLVAKLDKVDFEK